MQIVKSTAVGIAAFLVAIIMAACSSTPAQPGAYQCKFPDDPDEVAPAWICSGRKEGGSAFQSVGTAKIGSNLALSERRAAADARVKLAQQIQTETSSMLRDYAQEVATESGDVVSSSAVDVVTEEFVEQKIPGTSIRDRVVSPNNVLYVYVTMDIAGTKQMMSDAIGLVEDNEEVLQEKLNLNEAMQRLQERRDRGK